MTLDDVLAATAGASLRLVILDACRNNPQPVLDGPAQQERTADAVLDAKPVQLVELRGSEAQLDDVSVRLPIGIVDWR